MKVCSLSCIACLVFLVICGLATAGQPNGHYHLIKKYNFGAAPGGEEHFDYITVDSASRRVYLSHGTEVLVVNADTGAEVGTVPGLKRNHGIALAKDVNRGFTTDGAQGKVIIFDLKTLKVIGEIKTADDADCIIYDPASKRIFSFNGDSHSSTIIDPKQGTIVGTVDMGGAPEFAVADGKGTVYDNVEDKNEVVAIDSNALTIKSRWPVAPAGTPTALAMDKDHRLLFIAGRDPHVLVIMNADSGKVIQSFPITSGADANVYEPETRLLFVSTREGMIHVFHEDSPEHFSEVEAVKTEYGAKTMGVDAKTHHLFVDTADFGAPPAPTAARPRPNPAAIPGTFRLLVYGDDATQH